MILNVYEFDIFLQNYDVLYHVANSECTHVRVNLQFHCFPEKYQKFILMDSISRKMNGCVVILKTETQLNRTID